MIIRSQDKHRITTDLDIWMEHREIGTREEYWICNKTRSGLGRYSTAEKAIKVLDMICDFANGKHYETVVPEQCGCIGGVVFQMPQDSEV